MERIFGGPSEEKIVREIVFDTDDIDDDGVSKDESEVRPLM